MKIIEEQLFAALRRELDREKRLTYIAYGLIALVVILVVVFLGGFLLRMVSEDSVPPYVRIVLTIAVLGYAGYAVWKIVKLGGRARELDELSAKLETGARATNIIEYKGYKIILPLGKITYKMCPVSYQKFALNCDPMKFYTIAVNPSFAAEIKDLLSGADMEALVRDRQELYSTGAEAATAKAAAEAPFERASAETPALPDNDQPLKSVDEFRTFLSENMGGELSQMEDKRAASRKVRRVFGLAAGAVAVLWIGYIIYSVVVKGGGLSIGQVVVPMLILFGAYYVVYFLFLKPRMGDASLSTGQAGTTASYDVKSTLTERIVKFISPGAQYVMHGHISLPEMMQSGIFTDDRYQLAGSDLVIGKYRGVPFQFCNLSAEVLKRIRKENEGPSYAFYGQYFVARFNKPFSTTIMLTPRTGIKGFFNDSETSVHVNNVGQKVELEDPEFAKMFTVRAEDQVEARYILTPAMMERIKELAKRTGSQFYISFHQHNITLANNSGSNSFVVSDKRSLVADDYKVLIDFYNQFADQFAIIDELKLNIKIWG